MKITSSSTRPISPTRANASTRTHADAATTSSAKLDSTTNTNDSSKVELSQASKQLARSASDGTDDINVERVNAIRDAIASGQLKIDSSKIADNLIASAIDLLK